MKNPCETPRLKAKSLGRTEPKSPTGKPKFNGGKNPLEGYKGVRNPLK